MVPNYKCSFHLKVCSRDFPGSAVDRNQPANAGNMGTIPGLEGFHTPAEQLSPCATTSDLALSSMQAMTTEPACCNY